MERLITKSPTLTPLLISAKSSSSIMIQPLIKFLFSTQSASPLHSNSNSYLKIKSPRIRSYPSFLSISTDSMKNKCKDIVCNASAKDNLTNMLNIISHGVAVANNTAPTLELSSRMLPILFKHPSAKYQLFLSIIIVLMSSKKCLSSTSKSSVIVISALILTLDWLTTISSIPTPLSDQQHSLELPKNPSDLDSFTMSISDFSQEKYQEYKSILSFTPTN